MQTVELIENIVYENLQITPIIDTFNNTICIEINTRLYNILIFITQNNGIFYIDVHQIYNNSLVKQHYNADDLDKMYDTIDYITSHLQPRTNY